MALQNPTLTPNFSNIHFNFEPFLRKEYNFALDPDRPQCKFYDQNGACPNGANCFNKHVSPMFRNKVVCKHWLRGLCKKGDSCDYLHEYNLRKMPECLFFSKNGFCTQTPECIYLHIDPQTKIPECFNYNKGFCPDGPKCNKRHIRKAICELYLTGFCPYGMKCNMGSHPRFEGIMGRMRITPDKVKESQKEEKTKEEDKLANDNVAAAENVDDGNEEDDYKPEDHESTEPPANEEPNKLKRAAADSEEDSETPKKKART